MAATKRGPIKLEEGNRAVYMLTAGQLTLFIIKRESASFYFGYTLSQQEAARSMNREPLHIRISKHGDDVLSASGMLKDMTTPLPQLQDMLDKYDADIEQAKRARKSFLASIAGMTKTIVTPG